jgi:GTPase SAR1 family protein
MPIRRPRKQVETSGSEAAEKGLNQPARAVTSRPDREPTATAVYLSPDNKHLAVVTLYKELAIYRLAGEKLGERIGVYPIHQLSRATWSYSGTMIAFVDHEFNATVVNLLTCKSVVLDRAAAVAAVAFFPRSPRLAVLDLRRLAIRDADSPEAAPEIMIAIEGGTSRPNFTVSVSPDEQWIAWTINDTSIQLINVRSMERTQLDMDGATHIITDLEWLDPDTLAIATFSGVRICRPSVNRLIRILETEGLVIGVSYSPALGALFGWTSYGCFSWSAPDGTLLAQESLTARPEIGYRYLSASPSSDLLASLAGPEVSDIKLSHGLDTRQVAPPDSVSTYANAKILLLGDSGVGKSGLGLVLAGEPFEPTESTHARRIWKMPVPELDPDTGAQREVLLWDLAGQPGYRIVHQLHLSDGAVGLIVFDSRSETSPLAGVGYWARALRHAQAVRSEEMPAYLVGARTDRGVVGVSDERIAEIVAEFGLREYLATSAKEGWGIAELRAAVLAAIDWSRIPVVTSSVLFAAAKSFVLEQKAARTLLTPLASLLASFLGAPVTGPAAEAAPGMRTGRDLLGSGSGSDEHDRLRDVFDGCVARLESAGLVKRLAFGDLVLLQPELIDVYAGAIVNAARDEPDGLGSMLESRVLGVDFRLPEDERIPDRQQEKLLIIATLEELTRHEIVLREETEEGVQLVFPAAFRRDLPEAEPAGNAVEFTFEGPVLNVYVTLVVRLARSDRFTRRGTFQSAAQFEADAGGVCTVHLTRSDEGRGALQVGYSEDVTDVVRFQFERFVLTHLERRATSGTVARMRLYRCPDCGSPFGARQVELAVSRGRTHLLCPVDEMRVPLEGSYEALSQAQDAIAEEMNASADAARSIAAASSVILGKEETTDFDVFLCHNGDDKPDVRWTAQQLRQQGILPWLDEDELIPGRPWQDELERQIGHIRAAAVFVGPSGIGPWQNQEMRAFLSEFAERGCPVIPVILPGAAVPALPVFLRPMTWVDLRTRNAAGIERLIWGITGRKPGFSGLDERLE